MKRGGGGYCCGKGGGRRVCIFLNSVVCIAATFAWVVVVACLALSLSLILFCLSLPNYTDVPNADRSGTSYSSNIHTTSRRVNV